MSSIDLSHFIALLRPHHRISNPQVTVKVSTYGRPLVPKLAPLKWREWIVGFFFKTSSQQIEQHKIATQAFQLSLTDRYGPTIAAKALILSGIDYTDRNYPTPLTTRKIRHAVFFANGMKNKEEEKERREKREGEKWADENSGRMYDFVRDGLYDIFPNFYLYDCEGRQLSGKELTNRREFFKKNVQELPCYKKSELKREELVEVAVESMKKYSKTAEGAEKRN